MNQASLTKKKAQSLTAKQPDYYSLGMACLAILIKTEFQDKTLAKKACHFFNQAIQIEPKHFKAYTEIAYVLIVFGAYKEAEEYLDKSLEFAPHYQRAIALRAKISESIAGAKQTATRISRIKNVQQKPVIDNQNKNVVTRIIKQKQALKRKQDKAFSIMELKQEKVNHFKPYQKKKPEPEPDKKNQSVGGFSLIDFG